MSVSSLSQFTSNGLPVSGPDRALGPLSELEPGQSAQAHYREHGYVVIRGAVPRQSVQSLRKGYFERFPVELCGGADRGDGIFSGRLPEGLPPHGVAGHPAHDFVRSEDFKVFADQPAFRAIAETLLGGPVIRVPRTPLRHFIKGSHRASRAHADRTYLDEPETSCVTLWIPLGDCPRETGGLIYLENSHRAPELETSLREGAPTDRASDRRPISHDLAWVAQRAGSRWLGSDLVAGDIIAHVPTIIHASLDPVSDMMRVSTDLRFLRADVAVDPRWQQDWSADDGY
jgi:Phytanoyl-CoA dioxygenase (PhyH)